MEESETGEETGPATLHVPGALCVKVESLQGAPSLALACGGEGGRQAMPSRDQYSHVTHIECWQITGQALPHYPPRLLHYIKAMGTGKNTWGLRDSLTFTHMWGARRKCELWVG